MTLQELRVVSLPRCASQLLLHLKRRTKLVLRIASALLLELRVEGSQKHRARRGLAPMRPSLHLQAKAVQVNVAQTRRAYWACAERT